MSDKPKEQTVLGKIVGAISNVLSYEPKLTGLPATCFAVCDRSGKRWYICPMDKLEHLAMLQRQYERATAFINAHLPDKAKEAYSRHVTEVIQKSVQDESTDDQHEGWGPDDFISDYATKVQAAKDDMRRIYSEAVAIAAPIGERYCKAAEMLAADLEEAEHSRFENYCVEWKGPSPLVLEIRRTIPYVKARTKSNPSGMSAPSEIFPFLDL